MPETTEKYIRIPVTDCKITATIDISKKEGIKALYCGKEKKIATYLFQKDKDWNMDKAKKWVKDHKPKKEESMKLKQFIEELIQDAKAMWKRKDSEENKRDILYRALESFSENSSIVEVFPDVLILNNWKTRKYSAVEYSIKGNVVTFGGSQEVDVAYIPEAVQESMEKDNILQESLAKPHLITESRECVLEMLEMKDGKPKRLKGEFLESEVFNASEPRRLYTESVAKKATEAFNAKPNKFGLDGHKKEGKYGDIVFLHDNLYWKEGVGYFESEIITESEAGRIIQFIAEKKIPITVSLSSLGVEKFDKKREDKNGLVGGYVVQEGLEILTLDAVLHQAFSNAKAMLEQKVIREQKEKQANNEGGKDMDELKKIIEELTKSNVDLTKKVIALEARESGGLSEADKKLLTETRADVEKKTKLIEAKQRVVEILKEKAEELKEYKFVDVLQKHLENCTTKEEVDSQYPVILETLRNFEGKTTKPTDQHSIILTERLSAMDEKGFWGAMKMPNTVEEAWRGILDKFENKPYVHKMDNPRWIAKTLIENYLKLYIGNGYANDDFDISSVDNHEVLRESMQNPLYRLTQKCQRRIHETLGDTEMYTGDIAASAAYVLPLFTYVMKDLMDIVNGVCAIQALDRPTGEAWFMKEYYEDAAGTGTEVSANFSKTAAVIAEAGTPKQMRIGLAKTAITLKDSLAIYAPFTIELEQDLMATKGMSVDSILVQMMRREIFREISHQILYHMLKTAALTAGDGQTLIATDTFHTTPDIAGGWTAGEWITKGLTRAVKQTGAKMDVVPYQVVPDFIIAGSALSYLFTEKNFVADDSAKSPTNFGFRKVGTFQNEYALYLTSMSDFNDLLLLGYRGQTFGEAAEIFLPYILFWLGPRIPTTTAKASRTCKSRFAIEKASGRKLATIKIEA